MGAAGLHYLVVGDSTRRSTHHRRCVAAEIDGHFVLRSYRHAPGSRSGATARFIDAGELRLTRRCASSGETGLRCAPKTSFRLAAVPDRHRGCLHRCEHTSTGATNPALVTHLIEPAKWPRWLQAAPSRMPALIALPVLRLQTGLRKSNPYGVPERSDVRDHFAGCLSHTQPKSKRSADQHLDAER